MLDELRLLVLNDIAAEQSNPQVVFYHYDSKYDTKPLNN